MSTNLFAQLLRLLPGQPLLIGTVVSSGAGSTLVDLPDGSSLTVRGEATVASKVFVRAGAIEGPAPNLPYAVIEV